LNLSAQLPTVVCLEDDFDLAYLIEVTLRAWSAQVYTAYDGIHGLELIYQYKPNLILLDLSLPGLDGWEICTRVKNDPILSHIPIVVLTAMSLETQRHHKTLLNHVAAYVVKPFTPCELRALLHPFLS
jgi:DNA-binding response OmpR family regulator